MTKNVYAVSILYTKNLPDGKYATGHTLDIIDACSKEEAVGIALGNRPEEYSDFAIVGKPLVSLAHSNRRITREELEQYISEKAGSKESSEQFLKDVGLLLPDGTKNPGYYGERDPETWELIKDKRNETPTKKTKKTKKTK